LKKAVELLNYRDVEKYRQVISRKWSEGCWFVGTYLQTLAKKSCKICPPKTHSFAQLLEEEFKSTKVPREWC